MGVVLVMGRTFWAVEEWLILSVPRQRRARDESRRMKDIPRALSFDFAQDEPLLCFNHLREAYTGQRPGRISFLFYFLFAGITET